MRENRMTPGSAAMLGLGVGLAAGLRDYRRRVDDEMKYNSDTSQSALAVAQDAQDSINKMLENGDMLRLASNSVADLLGGLCFPGKCADPPPSAFISTPALLQFPDLTEALAVSPSSWPGSVNLYNEDGTLPAHVNGLVEGQNVAVGIAMGNATVRALLVGLTQSGAMPSPLLLAQVFRFARSLVGTIAGYERTPLSLANMSAAWTRFFGSGTPSQTPALFGPGIYSVQTQPSVLASFTTEAAYYSVPFPAGLLATGEVSLAEVFGNAGGTGGATIVLRARLNSLTGPVLAASPAIAFGSSEPYRFNVKLARLVDNNGSAVFATNPSYASAGAAGSAINGTPTQVNINHTVDNTIVFTAVASASDPANRVNGLVAFGQKF